MNTQTDRLPPHSVDAEASTLGCAILDSEAAKRVATLDPELFYDNRHKLILGAIKRLNGSTTLDKLHEALKSSDDLDKIGGDAYLVAIADKPPSAANLDVYIEDISGYLARRSAITDAQELERMAFDLSVHPSIVGDASRRLLESHARKAKSILPAITDITDAALDKETEPPQIITNLAHQGTKIILGGGSKSFKSWSLIDLCVSISCGVPFWGFHTTQGAILYINLEIPAFFFRKRVQSVAAAKNVTVSPDTFHHWCLRGFCADIDALLPSLMAETESRRFVLIIVDPIYKVLGSARDENSASHIATLCNAIEHLAVSSGAAVAFGSHYSKGNQSSKEAMDRISGSGVFARDPDTILPMTRHEEDNTFVIEPILRNLPQVEPFCLRWEFPLMVPVNSDPSKLRKLPGRPRQNQASDIVKLLPSAGATFSEWKNIGTKSGFSLSTFNRLLREARLSNLVSLDPCTDKYHTISR